MGHLPYLPPELIALIVDHLHGDTAALEACSLVSRAFLPTAQAHLFENIELRFRPSNGNIKPMRAFISPDPCGVLSYTQKLSVSYPGIFTAPSHLDDILDHFMAFSNIREFRIRLDTFNFVDRDLTSTSHYFSHFQPTLRSLDLTTFDWNPKDLILFITFFPFLEDLSLLFYDPGPVTVDPRVEVLDPNLLAPLRGTLRIRNTPLHGGFVVELTKVQTLYHTLELGGHILSPETKVSELVAACAPALRVLKLSHRCSLFPFQIMGHKLNRKLTVTHHTDLDSWMTFATCTQLAEVRLPVYMGQHRGATRMHAALLSTISSPHLRKIELTFNGGLSTQEVAVVLSTKKWEALEDVLLELTRRTKNTIQLVVAFQERTQFQRRCNELMPRFRKVGEVRFEWGSS